MPDIDTSMNRDPSPTGDELLAIRDRMLRQLESEPHRPVRIVRSANLLTHYWRADVGFLESRGQGRRPGTQLSISETLAETGERLDIERVGLIFEVAEVLR